MAGGASGGERVRIEAAIIHMDSLRSVRLQFSSYRAALASGRKPVLGGFRCGLTRRRHSCEYVSPGRRNSGSYRHRHNSSRGPRFEPQPRRKVTIVQRANAPALQPPATRHAPARAPAFDDWAGASFCARPWSNTRTDDRTLAGTPRRSCQAGPCARGMRSSHPKTASPLPLARHCRRGRRSTARRRRACRGRAPSRRLERWRCPGGVRPMPRASSE